MLQRVGDFFKRGRVAAVTVALISAALLITGKGLSDGFTLPGGSPFAAEGDGVKLDPGRARQALQSEQERLQQAGMDLEGPGVLERTKERTLERLIVSELLALQTAEQGYRVSGARLQQAIRSEPAFQIDGQYNETLALSRLAQIGATPESYRDDVRRSLQTEELSRAIGLGEFVTPVEIGRRLALQGEERELRYVILPAVRFATSGPVDPQALADWYASNGSRFATAESLKIEFIEISERDQLKAVTVSDDDLRAEYADRADEFQQPERRRLRHILVESEPAAQDVIQQLQSGAAFEDLARKISKDAGSSAGGGDLGISTPDAFVKPFADVAFSLGVGAISAPVKTEFGYHVIKVDEIQAASVRSLDEVRDALREQITRERAAQIVADLGDRVEQRIGRAGGDLASIAKDFNLSLRSIENFTRAGSAELSTDSAFISTVFSESHLVQRRLGGPVEVGDGGLVVFQVIDHRKSTIPPLDSVRAETESVFAQEQAATAARKEAERLVALINERGLPALADLKNVPIVGPRFISRQDREAPAAIRGAAFTAKRPAPSQVVASSVIVPEGAAIAVVSAVRSASPVDSAVRGLSVQSMQFEQGQSSLSSYVSDLRSKADVRKNLEAF
jgi:peptidyl-prolyl cis-trans isomerase D